MLGDATVWAERVWSGWDPDPQPGDAGTAEFLEGDIAQPIWTGWLSRHAEGARALTPLLAALNAHVHPVPGGRSGPPQPPFGAGLAPEN